VVLPEHADDACCFGVLLDQGGEQQGVFSSMVTAQSEAEAMAVEQEISRGVCDASAIAGGLLRGAKRQTKLFVDVEQLSSPCDEPRDVTHARMSVRAFIMTALFERRGDHGATKRASSLIGQSVGSSTPCPERIPERAVRRWFTVLVAMSGGGMTARTRRNVEHLYDVLGHHRTDLIAG
jgi:hypothetical protein